MNQTEAQGAYTRFDRKSKLISAALTAAGLFCLVLVLIFERLDSLTGFLISFAALVLWFVALCVIATRLNKTRLRLYRQGFAEEHTGLFRELMAEFEGNRFKALTDGKILFAEAHGSTIELELRRGKRTCHIVIDPGAVLLVLEEESAAPTEVELCLSDYADISQLFAAIRAYTERP